MRNVYFSDPCLSLMLPPTAVPLPALLPPSLGIARRYPQPLGQRARAGPILLCLSGLCSEAGFLPNFSRVKSLKAEGVPYFCLNPMHVLRPPVVSPFTRGAVGLVTCQVSLFLIKNALLAPGSTSPIHPVPSPAAFLTFSLTPPLT